MRVGIIGAEGFIAKNFFNTLQKESSLEISLYVRKLKSNSTLNFIPLDLTNNPDKNFFKGNDLLYYMLSDTIPASSWAYPKKEIDLNLVPFLNFLDCAVESDVKKVVFISSAGTIYGSSSIKVNEDFEKTPYSPYGINKLTMEYYLHYYKMRFNLNYDIYRISNVYGIGQDISKGLGVINTFLDNIIRHSKVNVFGDGKTIRNYIYINDVVRLLKISLKDINVSRTLNLSSNDEISINDLLKVIAKVIDVNFEINYQSNRKSDVPCILLDNSRILSLIDDFKFTQLELGILDTFNNMVNNVKFIY
jgi:UDP-glucose 4-epimerase